MATDDTIESAVGDIHVPTVGNKSMPIDTSIEFTPQNPFTIDIPTKETKDEGVGYPGFSTETEHVGFLKTALNEFKEMSTDYHILHQASRPLTRPASLLMQYYYPEINDKFYHPAPPGWSPKQEIEKLTNTPDSRFIPKLLSTKNPDDFKFQLDSINEEETRSQELQNGTTLAKTFGGALGLTIGSIENLIPIASIASKAKVGIGFLSAALRSAPSILAASAIHEGAYQMDKIDGNLPDFLKDTFIDSVFGATFFGVAGAGKVLLNISELNRLKKFSRDWLDGIGFNYKVDEKGNLKGFEAVDTTGGSVSAAKVTRAQEHADAAFYKGGLFKIPYVGDMAIAAISGNIPGLKYVFGSPLIQLKTSDYGAANAFADAAFDHFITTVGEAKGGTRPLSFEAKVKQTKAMLTSLKMTTAALHAERNGYSIKARPTLYLQNAWSAIKQKSIETLSRESKSTDWVSEPDFMEEVRKVMSSGVPHEDGAVNKLAGIYRKIYTDTAHEYLEANNLPKDYFRNMDSYLSRVYDTVYMNENEETENGWVPVISKYFADSDALITQKMAPIKDLEYQLEQHKQIHDNLTKQTNVTNSAIKQSSDKLDKLKTDLKYTNEKLQNELRDNPEYDYHIEDRLALSSDEAKELKSLTKKLNDFKAKADEQQVIVSRLKSQKSKSKSSLQKSKTVETAKKHSEAQIALEKQIKIEEEKLNELKLNFTNEQDNLQDQIRTNKVNPRLFNPLTFELKDPNNRLKFRNVFASQKDREVMAKASYDSIMNMHPEDIIADMFGRVMGNKVANPLKERTLLVPDELLYNNNFMSKDLYAKTANYVNYLSKRTHLKTSFNNVTVNGNFEEIAENLLTEYQGRRSVINQKIKQTTDLKEIKKLQKRLKKEANKFKNIKLVMHRLFENRMMGLNKRGDFDQMIRRTWMSLTAAANLHNLGATQITDIAWGGFQHGIWQSIRDGIYPIFESLGGILKTKDAEALREMAPSIHLGLQDMLNNYADRNWHSEIQPYLNMGKIVNGIEKFAHFSALTDLTPYIDNGIQRMNGSIIQAEFMRLLHKQTAGTLSEKESLYLRKYGIDPQVWAKRMVDAYKEANGFKTKLGGYMSKAWQWQDLEAANLFNNSVFRGIQNTLVWKGMADSPFFADNILGMFFHTFTGWTYAATNRYLIPSLQHPDGELLLKVMWMLGAGALVSPTRRIIRGEDPVPEDMTWEQRAYEAWQDSGVTSLMGNLLAVVNFMFDDKIIGNLKNDKFKNRMKTGIFGISDVISSTATRISDVLGMFNSGLDEKDLKTAGRMLPISGAMYGQYLSDKLIESRNLPRNKRAAKLANG